MELLATIILPVFGLLAFGYAATFTRFFDSDAAKVLASFVYYFVIPILLFRLLSRTELPETIPWATLAAYLMGITVSFGLAFAGARAAGFAGDRAGITGFSTAFGNTFLLGTPLVLTSFGEQAALPFFLIMTMDSVWLFALVTVACEMGRGDRTALRSLPLGVAQRLLTNPVLLGMGAGIAFNRTGLPLPAGVERWLELMGQAAIPCALFATGAALRAYSLQGALRPALAITAVKLLLQPLIVWILAAWIFDVPPLWAAVATFTAAMPTGVNAYIFAARYRAGEAEAAAAILLSTVLSVITLWIALLLLSGP
jgi:malonate transporter and related proteins